VLDLQVSSKKRLFEQVGLLFENQHAIARSVVFDSLFARERLGSTGLGQGVAIPHGRIKGLKEALGAFIRVAQPVPFDAPDGNPVTVVFVLLVPEKATEKHLQLLSELAQMFSDKALREAMSRAPDAAALHQLVTACSRMRGSTRGCMMLRTRHWRSPCGPRGGTTVRREAAQAASSATSTSPIPTASGRRRLRGGHARRARGAPVRGHPPRSSSPTP
jgi:PTS system nitrogen regulatory IIA component